MIKFKKQKSLNEIAREKVIAFKEAKNKALLESKNINVQDYIDKVMKAAEEGRSGLTFSFSSPDEAQELMLKLRAAGFDGVWIDRNNIVRMPYYVVY